MRLADTVRRGRGSEGVWANGGSGTAGGVATVGEGAEPKRVGSDWGRGLKGGGQWGVLWAGLCGRGLEAGGRGFSWGRGRVPQGLSAPGRAGPGLFGPRAPRRGPDPDGAAERRGLGSYLPRPPPSRRRYSPRPPPLLLPPPQPPPPPLPPDGAALRMRRPEGAGFPAARTRGAEEGGWRTRSERESHRACSERAGTGETRNL